MRNRKRKILDILLLTALLPFVTASVIIESTPGPNMAYLAIVSINDGRKAGYAVTAGVALGLLIIGIACAMGVGTLISSSDAAYQSLRIGGVGYLFWLAWDSWREENKISPPKTNELIKHAKFFRRGLITNLLNPKAAIFYIAILPGFTDPTSSVLTQIIFLTIIFVIIATVIHVIIVTLAGSLRPFLENPQKQQIARRTFALLLAGVAIWFAATTGREF